ncbi:MAG: tRNA (guanosine(46)-N7)-methyltransferase TrmB [Verrucomicrobia bacterium]|nr:tRNA (guanosine(46)-N7)-methyltransferase TrmB [Verrucomicrobiota bacterium]MBV8276316.1 tRNA (guanosine(46)-N7)-methyltransferase TrmB [Verrucomicrobiota bacterium]
MSLAEEAPLEALEEQQFEVFPADLCQPLLLSEIFGNDRPLEIDLGSGSGKFLVEAGRRYPERNFLGVERLLGRVRKTRRKACQLSLTNVRVLRVEIDYAVKYLLPADSVSRFHLSFPDPWPKRRHHSRRLVDVEFLEAVVIALESTGELWIKTDHADYFRWIEKIAAGACSTLQEVPWENEYPDTDFDETFAAENAPIYRLRLRKVSRSPR